MSGPSNAVVGDFDEPTQVPETQVPEEVLSEEVKLAKYSKTAEFKRLKEFMEARIQFFQRYLPNGTPVQGSPTAEGLSVTLPNGDLTAHWIAACLVIKEFENILMEYERAADAVKERRG